MKTSTKTFFVITIYLLGLVTVLAAPDPPPPNGRNQAPSPPGLPIDEYSMIFLALSLFFGMYVIFYHAQKNKQLDTK
jgi:hypothetical protein